MSATNLFNLTPLASAMKYIVLAQFLVIAQQAVAGPIINDDVVIDQNTPPDSYTLNTQATLTANNASTWNIRAQNGSTVNLNSSSVTTNGSGTALELFNSSGVINNSRISGATAGMLLGFTATGTGSTAEVNNSVISGGSRGVHISARSNLTLNNSDVVGTDANGIGLLMFDGTASATGGSIVGGMTGIVVRDDPSEAGGSRLELNGTRVEGQEGSAILVQGGAADIFVGNGASLTGGNGALLEVKSNGSANFTASDSATQLVGDVIVENGSTADVTLTRGASLTGRLENLSALAVNDSAKWVMVGNGEVANLAMDGGAIQFGSPSEFYQLSVGNLSGSGTFIMDADFTTGQVDTLNVTGTATGAHKVLMGSSGADPTADGQVPVIHIAAGDATFSLLNGAVDLGAYSYDLIKQGNNDWYLNTASRVISPGTQSVMALFNAAPSVWYGELSTLRSRMGEVRMDHGKAGAWSRAYGNKFDVSASSGLAYQQTQQGLSLGADAPLPVGDGQWLVGLMAGYSTSDLDMSRGTSGTVDSYYAGAYTTWMDEQSGYYLDGVLKFNRFQNESRVQLSDGQQTKGSFDNNGIGASLEVGRHIKLDDGYFVEPYTQLSGVIIQGKDYDLDNGLKAEVDRTRSLLGKVGATAGRNFTLDDGTVLQPYVRAAYVHEFANNNEVQVNSNVFNNDLSGSRGELGAGLAMTLTDKVSVHADFDYSNGDKIEQPWGANIGMRYSW